MNNSARTIYLASPYGFSEQWKRLLLPEFIGALAGKSKDDLQAAIQLVKSKEDDLDVPLQFENYR